MDVSWLESLLALVEHGGFTRAAEALHVSQPAFSRRIRALEQWAGTDLVDRSTFPATLTPAGVRLRARAADMVSGLSALRDEIRGSQLMPVEAVRVAISHTLATHFFTPWWQHVTAGAPHLTCRLLPSNTLDAYDSLVHGGCDLLLTYTDPLHPLGLGDSDLESVLVAEDRLAPYARCLDGRPEWTLAGQPRRPVPFVSHGAGAFLGRVTDRILTRKKPQLRPVVQSDLTLVLAELVVAGVGIGWLPGLVCADALTAERVATIGDATWSAPLEIRLYRNRRHRAGQRAAEVWRRATLPEDPTEAPRAGRGEGH